jgi:hypothetical protein
LPFATPLAQQETGRVFEKIAQQFDEVPGFGRDARSDGYFFGIRQKMTEL